MNNFKHPIVIASAVFALIIAGIGYWYVSKPTQSSAIFSPAQKQTLTEEISVNGPVTSAAAVDLAFERSGKIVLAGAQIGDTVSAGTALVALDSADVAAQLAGAQATLSSQQAKLDALEKGARPEDIAASQAALDKAKQDLVNLSASINDASNSDYAKANDAVRTQLNTFFSNAETNQPQLAFLTSNSQAAINAANLRVSASNELNVWQQELAGISPSSSPDILATALKKGLSHLAVIQDLLNTVSAILDGNVNSSLSAEQLATDRAGLIAGITEVNTAISSLNTISQNIASQQSTVAQAQAQLALKQAGSTPEDIAAQKAAVDGAQAAVDYAQAQLGKTVIRTPISGIITRQDAHVGAIASPNVPLVSMISNAAFQIEALVSEAEIAKIHAGEEVLVTLDAYGSGTSFAAAVVSVDPGATTNQGVASYRVVIQFKEKDVRIKAGMTANAQIITAQKENVLAIPWNSVIERDGTSFILVKNQNGQAVEREIKTGIRSGDMIEVVSGLQEGERVASFGTNQ